ncbi:MotA/TolQ/ExbB proton channel family protein [bacterium]|nr:MotA/TolQ/ExbB proton channel family protein [bacterium]
MINIVSDSINYWVKGGGLLIPIALVCYLIWYYFIQLQQSLQRKLDMPEDIQHEIEEQLSRRGQWAELKKNLTGQSFYFGRIVLYAIAKAEQGCELTNVFKEVWQKEVTPHDRSLVILQALVASAPLLGLLGTVFGMIGTFDAIAERSKETTELMASGVSQAMITTQFGLMVAIPGLFGINVLKKKMGQLQHHLLALQLHVSLALKRS